MNSIVEKNIPKKEQQGRFIVSDLAGSILVVSIGMLFATMFLGVILYRSQNILWPPMGIERLPLQFPLISSAFVLGSSVFFEAFFYIKEGEFKKFAKPLLLISLLLGLGFVFAQFSLWGKLKVAGIYANTGIFGSIIYGMTWTHFAHVFITLLVLFTYTVQVLRERPIGIFLSQVRKVWHFLTILWAIIFIGIFVI